MVDLVPDANPVKPALRSIQALGAFATAYRYPTTSGRIPDSPPLPRVMDMLKMVEAVLLDVAGRLDVDLAKHGSPSKRPGPIR